MNIGFAQIRGYTLSAPHPPPPPFRPLPQIFAWGAYYVSCQKNQKSINVWFCDILLTYSLVSLNHLNNETWSEDVEILQLISSQVSNYDGVLLKNYLNRNFQWPQEGFYTYQGKYLVYKTNVWIYSLDILSIVPSVVDYVGVDSRE